MRKQLPVFEMLLLPWTSNKFCTFLNSSFYNSIKLNAHFGSMPNSLEITSVHKTRTVFANIPYNQVGKFIENLPPVYGEFTRTPNGSLENASVPSSGPSSY